MELGLHRHIYCSFYICKTRLEVLREKRYFFVNKLNIYSTQNAYVPVLEVPCLISRKLVLAKNILLEHFMKNTFEMLKTTYHL